MKLVEGWWVVLWGAWSNWITLGVNVISAHALVFMAVLPFAPFYIQLPAAIGIALVASAPSWFSKIVRQEKLKAKVEAKRQEAGDASNP